MRASEVAELLELSIAAVNSALQRARSTLAARDFEVLVALGPIRQWPQARVTRRYVDVFERYDMDALIAVLHRT